MKSQRAHNNLVATDLARQPGDFPLGSPESRAAARAKLQCIQELSPYDRDCLGICALMYLTTYAHSPNSRDIQDTDVYKRGHELCTALLHIVPMHLDPFYQQDRRYGCCRQAYLFFHVLHDSLPISGDVLRREEIEAVFDAEAVEQDVVRFRAAWARRLREFPCPVKFENGKMWLRSADSRPGHEVWVQHDGPRTAAEIWPLIEAEVTDRENSARETRPAIRAVVFREDDAGNYYTETLEQSDNVS